MKILTFLTNIDQSKGGPSRSVPVFVKGLAELGIDITLMVIRSDDMNLNTLNGTTAKIHLLSPKYGIKDLEKFISDENFDIIHGQCIWEPLFHQVRVIAQRKGIPFILSPRGTLEPWSLKRHSFKKKIARALYQDKDLKKCACIYTTAEKEAVHIRKLGFSNPICVIPNGIENDAYPCRKQIATVKKEVLFLSRIHPGKGIEILINAWSKIHSQFSEWRLIIAGNGDRAYCASILKMIDELSLSDSIVFRGPVFGNEKLVLYQQSSLFVLPSSSENFGMVVAEALSCGVPVITTDNTPWGILNETHSGWYVPQSVESISKTLSTAMNLSSGELYDMGQRGSKMVNEKYNYRSCAMKNKALYEWVLNGGDEPDFMFNG